MKNLRSLRRLLPLLLSAALVPVLGPAPASGAQEKSAGGTARPMLWRDPGDIASRNLYWGSGNEQGAPKPPLRFVKEDSSGTRPKVHVTDANGVTWSVKFGEEAHSEVAASRIAWALGYMVEESYFVPSGRIEGARGLDRAKKHIGPDGSFRAARFEKRPDNISRQNVEWEWDSNPFVGTKELTGLIMLNSLLNNFDTKKSNNEVLRVSAANGTATDWYVVSDWGGTFGRGGGRISNSKWDLEDYRKAPYIRGVSGDRVRFAYKGLAGSEHESVPLAHARWFAGLLGQLSDEQLRDAMRAAGASEAEIAGFAGELRERIRELETAVGRSPALAASDR